MQNDPSKSKLVWGRRPQVEVAYSQFVVNGSTAATLRQSNRLVALGEYMGLIFSGGILESPVAIFQGIKRPYLSEGLDNFVFVYVSNPKCTFYYALRDRFKGTGPHEDGAPKSSVFVVFVSMAPSMIQAAIANGNSADDTVRGVILAWEWTPASLNDPRMPEFYQTRYRRMIWPAS
jgi:hypothetical protein